MRPARDMQVKDQATHNEKVYQELERITAKYPGKNNSAQALLPEFHQFDQALNIAASDQRLLVFGVTSEKKRDSLKRALEVISNHPDAIGKYHYDVAAPVDVSWADVVEGEKGKSGIFIIRADEFGMAGKVVAELSSTSRLSVILAKLAQANKEFSATEKRKNYAEHVSKGRRQGIKYEDAMPWGEDRDGDGKIDQRRKSPQSR